MCFIEFRLFDDLFGMIVIDLTSVSRSVFNFVIIV